MGEWEYGEWGEGEEGEHGCIEDGYRKARLDAGVPAWLERLLPHGEQPHAWPFLRFVVLAALVGGVGGWLIARGLLWWRPLP